MVLKALEKYMAFPPKHSENQDKTGVYVDTLVVGKVISEVLVPADSFKILANYLAHFFVTYLGAFSVLFGKLS